MIVWFAIILFLFLSFFNAGALVLFKTRFAQDTAAVRALGLAGWADHLSAGSAFFKAAAADTVVALTAVRHALIAQIVVAGFAVMEVVLAGGIAAIVAGDAVPVTEADVG